MIYELAKLRGQIAEDNIRKKINDGIYWLAIMHNRGWLNVKLK